MNGPEIQTPRRIVAGLDALECLQTKNRRGLQASMNALLPAILQSSSGFDPTATAVSPAFIQFRRGQQEIGER
jgi:hypothetical protein